VKRTRITGQRPKAIPDDQHQVSTMTMLSQLKNKRRGRRAKPWLTALIRVHDDSLGIPCIIWDISTGGAKLAVSQPRLVPEHFTLEFSTSVHRRCKRRWCSKRFIGANFVGGINILTRERAKTTDRACAAHSKDLRTLSLLGRVGRG
jgi:hypothetical protein